MNPLRFPTVLCFLSISSAVVGEPAPSTPLDDVISRAMRDELDRSMRHLALGDLAKPYFIQFKAQDRTSTNIAAAYGGLLRSTTRRDRTLSSRVRVGSYSLDNTNIGRSFGSAGRLPDDDDYTAIRHAIWRIVDADYKQAVEILTAKQAYLKDHTVEDRPDDFTTAERVITVDPPLAWSFDQALWEARLQGLSARFRNHPRIQDAGATIVAGTVTDWIINSEGTQLRTNDTGVLLEFRAELQADDGMELSDSRSYLVLSDDKLPPLARLEADLDEMCAKLVALASAPPLEQYTGPVLLEAEAAGRAFDSLLSDRLCARPTPLGGGGEDKSFEKRIGLRILPRTFRVYDDPREEYFEEVLLAGSYLHDDEGVLARRVDLVEKGILQTLVAGRSPTRKIKASTGHGRSSGLGDPLASVGCLYIEDTDGVSTSQLKDELIQAAKEEGLDFALRIETIETGGFEALGDPIYAYRVNVADGSEELIRGLKFQNVATRALKRVLAAGSERKVYNTLSRLPSSIIAPAVLFEELDLAKTQQEFERLPILKSPETRSP